jgi:hypothetical protein
VLFSFSIGFDRFRQAFDAEKAVFQKKKQFFGQKFKKLLFIAENCFFGIGLWALLGPSLAVPGAVLKNFWP